MSGLLDSAARLTNPWAYVVLGLLAAAESAAFVGLAIPGETAMLLGGFLAYQHRVGLPVMMAAGAIGAVVGDSVGYEIGRVFGEPLTHSRLGRRVSEHRWTKGEAYLRERGGKAVFLGRFVGVLRALVPALVGMSRMPYRTFLPWNVAGGLIWAPGFVLAGYLAGGSYRRVERIVGRASLLLLLAVVLVGGLAAAARWVARHPERVRALADRQLERPWLARLRDRYQRQLAFLARRLRPGGALGLSLTTTVLALVGAGWAFGAVLQDVLARDELELVDRPVAVFFVGPREGWLTRLLQDLTNLGSVRILLLLIVVVGVGWWLRRRTWRPLGLLAAAYVGADLAFNAVEELAALAAAATPRWSRKVAAWAAAVVIVGMVAVSQLDLGTHWLTDVRGGLALGAAWLFALLSSVRTIDHLRGRAADQAPPAVTEHDDPAPSTPPTQTRRAPATDGPHG